MNKFQAGDKVVAIVSNLLWIPEYKYEKGDVFTVSSCEGYSVWFEGRGNFSYSVHSFELRTLEDTSSASEQNTANYHIHHDLIVAWAKGAKIEFNTWNGWRPCRVPQWHVHGYKFRIAPEKTEKELEIERIESEMRKLADDLNKLKGV